MNDVWADPDLDAARQLAAALRAGNLPSAIATPIDDNLPLEECVYWRLSVGVWFYCADDTASYKHREVAYADTLTERVVMSTIYRVLNSAGKSRMRAQAQARWRYDGDYELLLASHEMMFIDLVVRTNDPGDGAFALGYRDSQGISKEDGAVVIGIDGPPLKLTTHAPHWLYVALTWLRTGRVASGY